LISYIKLSFSEEVLRLCNSIGDKAPGLTGMNMAFLQHNWYDLKTDILRMYTEIYSTRKCAKSLNATFIGLPPKKYGAHDVKDYLLISLVGCVYKLRSKVLAITPRGVIHSMISDKQNRNRFEFVVHPTISGNTFAIRRQQGLIHQESKTLLLELHSIHR